MISPEELERLDYLPRKMGLKRDARYREDCWN
jgi:hypothetical protein